ncbi:MAG: FAD:protein FMN transferase [Chloroflexota bacterium]
MARRPGRPPPRALPEAEAVTEPETTTARESGGPDRIVAFAARSLGSALRLSVRFPTGTEERSAAEIANRAWTVVQAEFTAVDLALSRFRDDSELTMLNRIAGSEAVVPVSWRLRRALAAIDRAARVTGNRFDATVLGALERIGEHGADLDQPSASASAGAPVISGTPGMRAPGKRLVHVPPVPVDLGGIGKGLALRWASAAAVAALPPDAGLLLEAGGDIVCAGSPPAESWRIGVEDPVSPPSAKSPPLAVLDLRSGAVTTSSVRVRNWIGPDGRPVHHLVDPKTREPARSGLLAVTVAGPDPAWAEVWSKALFVTGRESIGDLARARGLAAWWIDDRGRLGMTPEARIRTLWAREERLG